MKESYGIKSKSRAKTYVAIDVLTRVQWYKFWSAHGHQLRVKHKIIVTL